MKSVYGSLTEDSERLTSEVRYLLGRDQCAIAPRNSTDHARMFALAALAHCSELLEELDVKRRSGNELVGRLIARAHLESWLLGMWLLCDGDKALKTLHGAHRKALRKQHDALSRVE